MLTMNAVLAILVLATAANGFDMYEQEWHTWKVFHGKTYATEQEENVRYAIWLNNLKKILTHNAEEHSYKLTMNKFGDLTDDEYRFLYLGLRTTYSEQKRASFMPPNNVTLPTRVDWRERGYVTRVKDQGTCGSCWAFSATGSLEGQHFKKTGNLVSLSEQNLVDCSSSFGNYGCQGGLMDNAFRYIIDNNGIDTEPCYPYEGTDESCRFERSCVGATCTGYMDIQSKDEEALHYAVATTGPISVGIDAALFSFRFYKSGVYDDPACSSTLLNHGVLAVGYGNFLGSDYWMVKNSWGVDWGNDGYIMMSRNKNNQCGIATLASYPTI